MEEFRTQDKLMIFGDMREMIEVSKLFRLALTANKRDIQRAATLFELGDALAEGDALTAFGLESGAYAILN